MRIAFYVFAGLVVAGLPSPAVAQGTRLLRQPSISADQVAFEYGGDLWIASRAGGEARRLTSTPAVESNPYLSPDGKWVAFTSNRSGNEDVYVVSAEGGEPRRLTWHPLDDEARGWTPDGKSILIASQRETAPVPYMRLWTVPAEGGVPTLLPAPMAYRGSFSPDGRRIVYDRVSRWDVEWRNYRGGQNTPLTILTPATLAEVRLPNDRTTDTQPVWVGNTVYFLSDRDFATNVWAYDVAGGALRQVTHFKDADVKSLGAGAGALVIEQDGWLQLVDPSNGTTRKIDVTVHGDFPWAMPRWDDVSHQIASASLSPTGKRALFQARGEVFTVPVDQGDSRNLTRSPGADDRTAVWSPDGKQVAWFSDDGSGYRLLIGDQDGLESPRAVSIGDAKFAYSSAWSPDGSRIAFVDDHARIRVIEVATGRMTTADVDGALWNRAGIAPVWSPDSKWLAYSKIFDNRFRRIVAWSVADGTTHPITDGMADAVSPVWDRNGRWLYFLASTDLGLASGWANISGIGRQVTRGATSPCSRPVTPRRSRPRATRRPAIRPVRPASRTPPGRAARTRSGCGSISPGWTAGSCRCRCRSGSTTTWPSAVRACCS